jgi:hypothetical protein
MRGIGSKTAWLALAVAAAAGPCAYAALHVTLANGYDLICDHRVADGSRVRLYMDAGSGNFIEVSANEIVTSENVDLPTASAGLAGSDAGRVGAGQVASDQGVSGQGISGATSPINADQRSAGQITAPELHQMLATAGTAHNLDVDLLASVVRAESGGNAHAVSRTGARGLMQLMPGTAAGLGVADSFAPEQNIGGGTAYLDGLLRRYHDNLALALAAYNAGPQAVDRWHGIPPYRETRQYVARVIHEFNRRITARQAALAAVASAVR